MALTVEENAASVNESNIKSSQIKKIFITHMHGDHIYGLPGLLATLGLSGNSNGIEIYGPADPNL